MKILLIKTGSFEKISLMVNMSLLFLLYHSFSTCIFGVIALKREQENKKQSFIFQLSLT